MGATIDEIELCGEESILLRTTDAFYSMFSGYKVIVIQERPFWHKQLCGFTSVKSAKEAWDRLKKKHNYTSWADQHCVKIKTEEIGG